LTRGHQLLIVTYPWNPPTPRIKALLERGASWVQIPFPDQEGEEPWPSLFAFVPELVIVSSARAFEAARLASLVDYLLKSKIPYVVLNAGDGVLPEPLLEGARQLYNEAHAVGFLSRRNQAFAERALGVELPNVLTIRSPVNLVSREIIPFPSLADGIRFACVARLHLQKGYNEMLEAFAAPGVRDAPWTLNLFGEGEHRTEIEESIKSLGLEGRVTCCGFTDDIESIWRTHHAFVLASPSEGVPLSMMEAMVCGRPSIVTDVGGISEWVKEGREGFLAPNATATDFALALQRALAVADEWEAFGIRAHARTLAQLPADVGAYLLDQVAEKQSPFSRRSTPAKSEPLLTRIKKVPIFKRLLNRMRAHQTSVIIPARNAAEFLPQCLESVFTQQHGCVPGEVLVIDDDSEDSTREVVESLRKKYRAIRYFHIKANNANRARILGLSMSRGKYIILLDADNWLEPDFVSCAFTGLMEAAESTPAGQPPPVFAYTDRIMHYEARWHPHQPKDSREQRVSPGPFENERLRQGNDIDICALFTRSAVQLDPSMRCFQDWDLWLRLSAQGLWGVQVPQTAFHYRVHDKNLTLERCAFEKDMLKELHARYQLSRPMAHCLSRWPKVSIVMIGRTQEELDEAMSRFEMQDYPAYEFCTSTVDGFAAAWQDAMNKVSGDIAVFTETDCYPATEQWLKELVLDAGSEDEIVLGMTMTETSLNMANTAVPAALLKKYPRNPEFGASEDTEWFLRMQKEGVNIRWVNRAVITHLRPPVNKRLMERSYQYGRDWIQLIQQYHYYDQQILIDRFETNRKIAEETLRGIHDELNASNGKI